MASTELSKVWWRVNYDPDGKVKGIRAVERAQRPGDRTFYVLAANEADARTQAKALFDEWKRLQNADSAQRLATRRAENEAQGRCRCGREKDDPTKAKCASCRELDNEHHRRSDRRAKGENIPKRDRRQVLRERKEQDSKKLRLDVYRDVLEAARRASSLGELKRWLTARMVGLDREIKGAQKAPEAKAS